MCRVSTGWPAAWCSRFDPCHSFGSLLSERGHIANQQAGERPARVRRTRRPCDAAASTERETGGAFAGRATKGLGKYARKTQCGRQAARASLRLTSLITEPELGRVDAVGETSSEIKTGTDRCGLAGRNGVAVHSWTRRGSIPDKGANTSSSETTACPLCWSLLVELAATSVKGASGSCV